MTDWETHDFVVGGFDDLIEDFARFGGCNGIVFCQNGEDGTNDISEVHGASGDFHTRIAEVIGLVAVFDVLPVNFARKFNIVCGPVFHPEKRGDKVFVVDFTEDFEPFRHALDGRHRRKAGFHQVNGHIAIRIHQGVDIEARRCGPGGENAAFGEIDGRGLGDEIAQSFGVQTGTERRWSARSRPPLN